MSGSDGLEGESLGRGADGQRSAERVSHLIALRSTAPAPQGVPRFRQHEERVPSVSIVIPTLNDAPHLRQILTRIPSWVDDVVLVDGGSRDDTLMVAKDALESVRVFLQSGRGKGNALIEGFAHATGDIIVTLDADGSTDPAELPRFIAALRTGADFAKGTRFIAGGGSADLTTLRRTGNWVLTRIVNRTFGTAFTDLCYGYNAFWRHCLPDLSIDGAGYEIETLLTLRAVRTRIRIVEVPSYESARHTSCRRQTGRDGLRVLRTIFTERFRSR